MSRLQYSHPNEKQMILDSTAIILGRKASIGSICTTDLGKMKGWMSIMQKIEKQQSYVLNFLDVLFHITEFLSHTFIGKKADILSTTQIKTVLIFLHLMVSGWHTQSYHSSSWYNWICGHKTATQACFFGNMVRECSIPFLLLCDVVLKSWSPALAIDF